MIYNDYGMETNQLKFDGIKGMLSWVQSENVGLTGVGWQLHVYVDDVLDANFPLATRMQEISNMGLKNYITELDIRIQDYSSAELARQKAAYKKITQIFLSNPTRGEFFQTWGLSDAYTWWNDFDPSTTHYPLPFDTLMQKKLAYAGMQEAFAEYLNAGSQTGNFRLRNIGSDLYLTQSQDFTGAPVNVQYLDTDWSSQQWTVTEGPDATSYLSCDWRGWYLNVGDNVAGTEANVYTHNPDWWSMMWLLETVNTSTYRLRNRWSNLYLTAGSGNVVTIEALDQNSDDQLWLMTPLDDCIPNYVLTGTLASGTNTQVQTSDWITATATLLNGASVSLYAENSIELQSGFNAALGSDLIIDIATCGTIPNSPLSNPNATAHARIVYDFLTTYQDDPNQCVILGQNLGWNFEKFDETVQTLKNQTGSWPGVIGGQMRWDPDEIDYPVLVNLYSDWQANGGVVELSMLPDNPWTGGDSWDRSVTDIWKLTTPGQEGYAAWRNQLDFYAAILEDMQDAGITILWRPLMEMNGDWFWYGYTGDNNPQPFIDLYRDMYDYFTNTKQLNNLIWIYSANMAYTGIPAVDHYYPGADVVDITGLDVYQDNIALPSTQYQAMINLGKPFAITEFGPDHNNMDGQHDYHAYVNKIRADFPESIYALAWHDWPGHLVAWISNQNYSAALNEACVVGRDEIAAW